MLWDLASGRLIKRMRGHSKLPIWSLDWSVESTVLVSGAADCTVRVWDIAPPAPEQPSGQARITGDAGIKGDGTTGAQPSVSTTTGPGTGQKKGKENVVTPDQISAFPTKRTPVYKVKFTRMNLILAGGCSQ